MKPIFHVLIFHILRILIQIGKKIVFCFVLFNFALIDKICTSTYSTQKNEKIEKFIFLVDLERTIIDRYP